MAALFPRLIKPLATAHRKRNTVSLFFFILVFTLISGGIISAVTIGVISVSYLGRMIGVIPSTVAPGITQMSITQGLVIVITTLPITGTIGYKLTKQSAALAMTQQFDTQPTTSRAAANIYAQLQNTTIPIARETLLKRLHTIIQAKPDKTVTTLTQRNSSIFPESLVNLATTEQYTPATQRQAQRCLAHAVETKPELFVAEIPRLTQHIGSNTVVTPQLVTIIGELGRVYYESETYSGGQAAVDTTTLVDALTTLARSESADVRQEVAQVLTEFPYSAVNTVFKELSNDPDPGVRNTTKEARNVLTETGSDSPAETEIVNDDTEIESDAPATTTEPHIEADAVTRTQQATETDSESGLHTESYTTDDPQTTTHTRGGETPTGSVSVDASATIPPVKNTATASASETRTAARDTQHGADSPEDRTNTHEHHRSKPTSGGVSGQETQSFQQPSMNSQDSTDPRRKADKDNANTKYTQTPMTDTTNAGPPQTQTETPDQSAEPDFFSDPPEVDFDSVFGRADVIQRLRELIILPLVDDTHGYTPFDVEIPNGVIFYGPPGTGKTLTARALAGELQIPFADISIADLDTKWLGAGADNIEAIYEQAREHEPAIVFIDEIDAVGINADTETRSHKDDERTYAQLLKEFTRLEYDPETTVITIGTTNRISRLSDPLLRPGRFTEKIEFAPVDAESRSEILSHVLSGPQTESLEIEKLQRQTAGLTGSELTEIAEIAKRKAARRRMQDGDSAKITLADIDAAIDNVQQQRYEQSPFRTQDPTIELADVIGAPTVIRKLTQNVIKPAQLETHAIANDTQIPITPKSGLLFSGPPGTGKSYTARAVAGELDYNYLELTAADLTSRYFGGSAAQVQELFEEARYQRPAVVTIEEIDAIGRDRAAEIDQSSTQQMVNQLLEELSRLAEDTPEVIVIGTTNRPDAIDPALTTNNRLSTQIQFTTPTHDQREALINYYLPDAVSVDSLSEITTILKGESQGTIKEEIITTVRQKIVNNIEPTANADVDEQLSELLTEYDITLTPDDIAES